MTRCPLCHRTNCPEPDGGAPWVVMVACVVVAALIAAGGFAYGLWLMVTEAGL